MSASPAEILRQQLRKKFPRAHALRAEPTLPDPARGQPFQVRTFPAGTISEVVPAGAGAGLSLLVACLLGEPEESSPHPQMVLVDGADSFDPVSFQAPACSRLLWVRCHSALEMARAADLLIHDGNVPFVLLDATGLGRKELARIPASAWWRMKLAAERVAGRVVVLAPFPLVPCAGLRFSLRTGLSLHDFDAPRGELLERLQALPETLRLAT